MNSLFNDCGKAIKTIAKIYLIFFIVLAFIVVLIDLADTSAYLLGSFGAIAGVFLALVGTGVIGAPIIYGFGEIVDCIREMRDKALYS